MFDKMIKRCENGGEQFGNEFLDYQNINIEELICYMNMALCGTSNIRFKEKMFYEKLSDAITISEEAFGVLVFENYYKRWLFSVKKELKIGKLKSMYICVNVGQWIFFNRHT